MSDRTQELNKICLDCQNKQLQKTGTFSQSQCSFCHIGREVHELEVRSGNSWTKVDWNHFKFKDYYHG